MNNDPTLFPPISLEDVEGSIFERFQRVARSRPLQVAVATDEDAVTYGDLAIYVDNLAHEIAASTAPGDRVALLGRASPPLIAAMLAILKIGRVLVILHVEDAKARLELILQNAAPTLLLATDEYMELARSIASPRQRVGPIVLRHGEVPPVLNFPDPYSIASIVYTSGSTGAPKGVVLSHRCLHSKSFRLSTGLGYRSDDRQALLYAMSTGGGSNIALAAILSGAELHIFPTWRQGNEGLAPWLLSRRITFLSCAASGFRQFSRALEKGRSFPYLRRVRLGFESVLPEDFFRWRELAPQGAIFCATLSCTEAGHISYISLDHDATVDETGAFSSGRPFPEVDIRLEDDDGSPTTVGEIGEIIVRSDYLADAYWNLPELTQEKFRTAPDGVREYRTGDFGRIRPDGTLEHRGRKDGQVKVRGYRIEYAEVEAALLAVTGAQAVAATMIHGPASVHAGEPPTILAGFIVIEPGTVIDERQVRAAMLEKVASYLVPSRIFAVESLPCKVNGKIDRGALSELARALTWNRGTTSEHRPLSPTEELLADLWRGALGVQSVGPDQDFLELGGDSLSSAVIVAQVHRQFGLELDLKFVSDYPTVASMAAELDLRLSGGSADNVIPLEVIPRGGALPVPFTQERMARVCHVTDNSSHMLRRGTILSGPVDRDRLRESLQLLTERHEYLRSSFHVDEGIVTQQVHSLRVRLPFIDLRSQSDPHAVAFDILRRTFRSGLPLDRAPLMRFLLARLSEEDWYLMTVAHHILLDSAAWDILFDDLAAIYSSLSLARPELMPEPLKIQIADYAAWQRAKFGPDSPQRQRVLAWWRESFRDAPPLRLPTLREQPRPDASFEGSHVTLIRTPECLGEINKFRHREGVTWYVLGLAALRAQLAVYGNLHDAVLGTYISLRARTETLRMVGDFANFIPLRLRIDSRKVVTFRDLVRETRRNFFDSRASGEISFDEIYVDLEKNGIAPPDIQCIYAGISPHPPLEFAGLKCQPNVKPASPQGSAPMKRTRMPWRCSFTFTYGEGNLKWHVGFDTRLHSRTRMKGLMDELMALTMAACSKPDLPLDVLKERLAQVETPSPLEPALMALSALSPMAG